MFTSKDIESAIQESFTNAMVEVNSADGVHFSAKIAADEFLGLTRVQQHQLVYRCLSQNFGENWSDLIHALEIKIVSTWD